MAEPGVRQLATEPVFGPPPPWSTVLQAVVWWHRATPAAIEQIPEALRCRWRVPVTVAGLARYEETPAGAYHEILATPVLLPGLPLSAGTIPFIAVDSLASMVAGRANWGLPKTLARFEWPADGLALSAHGDGWTVITRVRPRGAALPFALLASNRQLDPDGALLQMTVRAHGRARFARATVRISGARLSSRLRDGSHPAIVVTRARMNVSPARPVRRPRWWPFSASRTR